MAVGQPTRPRYQRLAPPHQSEVYLANPPDSIPTGNVPVLLPRQAPDVVSSLSASGNDVSISPGPPSGTPLDSPSFSQSQPPSTNTDQPTPTISPSTSVLPSQTTSTTPPSTTPQESSSTNSVPSSSTPSQGPSITPSPLQSFGFLNSTSLPYSPDTTITSPVVLTIDGTRTTSYVLVPTTISDPGGDGMSSSERTAVIAGSVAGGFTFILLVAAIILFYRRHQNKKKGFFPASEPKPRTMLLAGEDLDDDFGYSRQTSNAPTPLPSSVRRVESPISNIPRSSSVDHSPRLLRPRASDTGSIFHEGGIWPPPSDGSKLVDPILASSNINLSNIVDDVMGSSAQQNIASGSNVVLRPRGGSGDTVTIHSEGSIYSTDLPVSAPNQGQSHSRGASANSEVPLIPPEPLYLASTHNSGSSLSILSQRNEQGFDPSRSSTSIPNPYGARNWLDRSPRKLSESPTDPFNRNSSPSAPGNG